MQSENTHMDICTWLKDAAKHSTCLDKKVACVLADHGKVVSTGYNKTSCTTKCAKFSNQACEAIHAEEMAVERYIADLPLSKASKKLPELTAYVTYQPCNECLKFLKRANVVELYYFEESGATMDVPEGMKVEYIPPVTTPFMNLNYVLDEVRKYHKLLGYPDENGDRYTQARELLLAIHQEVSELTDSVQWKPWRAARNFAKHNFLEEIADVIIFLDSLLMNFDCTWSEVAEAIRDKVEENVNRINRGYHK